MKNTIEFGSSDTKRNELVDELNSNYGDNPDLPAWLTLFDSEITTALVVFNERLYVGNTGLRIVKIRYADSTNYEFWFSPNGITNPDIAKIANLGSLNLNLFALGLLTILENMDHPFLKDIELITGETTTPMVQLRKRIFDDFNPTLFEIIDIDTEETVQLTDISEATEKKLHYAFVLNFKELKAIINSFSVLESSKLKYIVRKFKTDGIRVINPALHADNYSRLESGGETKIVIQYEL